VLRACACYVYIYISALYFARERERYVYIRVCVIRVLRDKLNEENFWASFGAWCLRPNYIFGFVSERKTDRDWVPKKQN